MWATAPASRRAVPFGIQGGLWRAWMWATAPTSRRAVPVGTRGGLWRACTAAGRPSRWDGAPPPTAATAYGLSENGGGVGDQGWTVWVKIVEVWVIRYVIWVKTVEVTRSTNRRISATHTTKTRKREREPRAPTHNHNPNPKPHPQPQAHPQPHPYPQPHPKGQRRGDVATHLFAVLAGHFFPASHPIVGFPGRADLPPQLRVFFDFRRRQGGLFIRPRCGGGVAAPPCASDAVGVQAAPTALGGGRVE